LVGWCCKWTDLFQPVIGFAHSGYFCNIIITNANHFINTTIGHTRWCLNWDWGKNWVRDINWVFAKSANTRHSKDKYQQVKQKILLNIADINTSASSASSVNSKACECFSTSVIFWLSYSFIWHPKVRIYSFFIVVTFECARSE
jgi:hypothetical protein